MFFIILLDTLVLFEMFLSFYIQQGLPFHFIALNKLLNNNKRRLKSKKKVATDLGYKVEVIQRSVNTSSDDIPEKNLNGTQEKNITHIGPHVDIFS